MNLKTSKQLVEEAMQEIVTLEAAEVKSQLNNNLGALLIDIRDIKKKKKLGTVEYSKRYVRVLAGSRKSIL